MSGTPDQVVISEPGRILPRRVSIAASQLGWGINETGSFSGFTELDALREAGLAGDLRGMWLEYESAAGAWGGVITAQTAADGIAEIVAEGWAALLRGDVLTNPMLSLNGSAGGCARRVIRGSGADGPLWLTLGPIDEGGGPVALDLNGDIGADLLPQIADAGDVEWIIDAERMFYLARRLGRDRSASVRLVEDRHIIGARVNDDSLSGGSGAALRVQSELSQSMMAFAASQGATVALQPPTNPAPPGPGAVSIAPRWDLVTTGSRHIAGEAWDSLPEGVALGGAAPVATWHRSRRDVGSLYQIEQPGIVSVPASSASPPAWSGVALGIGANHPGVPGLRHAPPPTAPAELTLANVDDCWLTFDLGDTVRIDLGSIGVSGWFRAVVKFLDVASQTLTVSGELLRAS